MQSTGARATGQVGRREHSRISCFITTQCQLFPEVVSVPNIHSVPEMVQDSDISEECSSTVVTAVLPELISSPRGPQKRFCHLFSSTACSLPLDSTPLLCSANHILHTPLTCPTKTFLEFPIHIHPENGNYNVCRNVRKSTTFDVAHSRKPKFHSERQQKIGSGMHRVTQISLGGVSFFSGTEQNLMNY
jgi:hypothetical protein